MIQPRPREARVKFSTPWNERLTRLRLDRTSFVLCFCVIGLAGGAWIFQGHQGTNKDSRGVSKGPVLNQFDLKVQGELTGLSPIELEEMEVTLYFPQMPYKVTKGWKELEHPRQGVFLMPVQLRTEASASLCHLRLQFRDKTLPAGKIQVEAGKPGAVFPPFRVKL